MNDTDIAGHRASGLVARPRPRRVAALMSTAEISGPGRQLAALGRGLAERGVELRVVLFERKSRGLAGYDRYLAEHGVGYEIIPDAGPIDPAAVRAAGRFIESWQPDIVQSHAYKTAGIAYALRWLGNPVPWIGFFHGETDLGMRDRLYNRVHYWLLGAADRVVVMSERQLVPFARRPGHARIIHNAVLEMPKRAGAERNLDRLLAFRAAAPRPLIGVIGRLSHEKGVDILLEALGKLAGNRATYSLAIVGEGPLRSDLEAKARTLGVSERVLFAGRIEAMHDLYPALDLMVIPSRSEGLPNVLLEAMGADIPVVSTNVGAVPELLALVPDAFQMVPAQDPTALADGIAEALREAGSDRRRQARAEITRQLSPERRVERHLQVYADVLEMRGRR